MHELVTWAWYTSSENDNLDKEKVSKSSMWPNLMGLSWYDISFARTFEDIPANSCDVIDIHMIYMNHFLFFLS